MGPWSVFTTDWMGLPVPLEGISSTSIVYHHPDTQRIVEEPYTLFCDEDDNGCHLEGLPPPPIPIP